MQRKPTKAFWRSYSALYGNAKAEPWGAPKKRAKPRQIERQEQIKFNVWFDKFLWSKGYRWFHPANGGSRGNAIEGVNFKRMGVKAGVPDVILPMARKSYHGLVIELKRPDGKLYDLADEQIGWLDWFTGQNWSVHLAFGFEEAQSVVKDYFTPRIGFDEFSKRTTTWQILKQR